MTESPNKRLEALSDEELLEEPHGANGRGRFDEIYERYALRIYQKCLSFTKDDMEAKDLAHDVMIKIYLNLSKFNKRSKFSTWVYSITYNHCVDYQAKKVKQLTMKEELARGSVEPVEEPDNDQLMNIDADKLIGLLEQLTPVEKSIILMKYQDGFSIKEISDLTGSGASAIKMKLKRTKAKLVKLYEEER